MIQYIGESSLHLGNKVEVYYNSKNKSLSIRQLESNNESFNRIIGYAEYLHLENAVFCNRGGRTIIRGNYAGSLPVFPKNEHIILESEGKFYDLHSNEVTGASFCVCYLNMILAEGKIYQKEQRKII